MELLEQIEARDPDQRVRCAAALAMAADMLNEWDPDPDGVVAVCGIGHRCALRLGDLDMAAEWGVEEALGLVDLERFVEGRRRLEALARDERLGATPGRVYACAAAVRQARTAWEFDRAEACAALARATFEQLPEDTDAAARAFAEACCLEAEIDFALVIGRPDLALGKPLLMIAAAREGGGHPLLARAHLLQIEVLAGLERFAAAERFADRALSEIEERFHPQLRAAKASAIARQERDGSVALRRALDEVDQALEASPQQDLFRLRCLIAKVDWMSRVDAAQQDQVLPALESAAALLARLQRVRPESLLQHQVYLAALQWRCADARARAEMFDDLLALHRRFVRHWAASDAARRGGARQYDASNLVLEALLVSCLERDAGGRGEWEALELLLETQGVGGLVRRLGAGPQAAAAQGVEGVIASLVPEGGGVLVYAMGWHHLCVAAVDAAGVRVVIQPEDQHALDQRQRFAADLQIHGVPRGAAREAARAVARHLLPERIWERVATWRAVRVAGLDEHGHVPLEWLPVGDHLVGDDRACSYLPSLPAGLVLAGRRAADGAPVTLLGDAIPGDTRQRWGPLQDIALDPATRADWPGRLVDGAAATSTALFAAASGRVAVIAHGVFDRELNRAGLVLADGPLWVDQIADASFGDAGAGPAVVTLLACGAARQVAVRGADGGHGLAGAFLAAGAQAVLLSSERLRLDFAVAAQTVLERELRRGASPERALLVLRQELAETWEERQPALGLLRVVGL